MFYPKRICSSTLDAVCMGKETELIMKLIITKPHI